MKIKDLLENDLGKEKEKVSLDFCKETEETCNKYDYFEREEREMEIYSWLTRIPPKNPWRSTNCTVTEMNSWEQMPKVPLSEGDYQSFKEYSMPTEPSLQLPAKTWLKQEIEHFLEVNRNHPVLVVQRKAVSLYKDRKFKLVKQVTFSSLIWNRGTVGYTLDWLSLGLLPDKAQELLSMQLKKGVVLCSLGEYIYTLPEEYLRYEEKEMEGQSNLF